MYTWYARILLDSGNIIYVALRNVSEKTSEEVTNSYFCKDIHAVTGFNDMNTPQKSQVWVMLGKIQAYWISQTPFDDKTEVW